MNGECVTIDGGQWLRGAGQFNELVDLPEDVWDAMEAARKAKKKEWAGGGDGSGEAGRVKSRIYKRPSPTYGYIQHIL